ncbi:hypothetical protein GCM10027180_04870 [Microbulbifer echini]
MPELTLIESQRAKLIEKKNMTDWSASLSLQVLLWRPKSYNHGASPDKFACRKMTLANKNKCWEV